MMAKRFMAMVLAGAMVLSSLEMVAADTVDTKDVSMGAVMEDDASEEDGASDEVLASAVGLAADNAEDAENSEGDSTITVYFDNSGGWDMVYAYSTDSDWNVLGGAWPGDEMTLVESGTYAGWYMIELDVDTYYVTFADESTGSQTGNIKLSEASEENTYWITYNGSTVYASSPIVELDDIEPIDWWTVFTEGFSLSVGQTLTFTGTTTSYGMVTTSTDEEGETTTTIPAWDNAIYVLYSSDDGNLYAADTTADNYAEGVEQNYTEYFVGRLDNYGWGSASYTATSAPDDWEEWLAETQASAAFTIQATYSVDGNVTIVSECGDARYTMSYTVSDTSQVFYMKLTGEKCKLTNLVATYGTAAATGGITVYFENTPEWETVYGFYGNSDWVESYAWPGVLATECEDNEGWYEVEVNYDTYYIFFNNGASSEGNRTCWATLQQGTATEYWITYEDYAYSLDDPYNEIPASTEAPDGWVNTNAYTLIYELTEQDELVDMECEGWWTTFSEALSLADGQKLVITGTTTNLGEYNYDNLVYILYSGDGGIRTFTYKEYFVGRVDNYGWGTAGYMVTSAPDDWDAWLAATQEGAEFTLTVTYLEGVITIEVECLEAAYMVTYEVSDSSLDYYIALSGEYCELTDLSYTRYEAVTDLSDFTITLSEDTYTYDGTEKTPDVTVAYDGVELVQNQDYLVIYSNNVEVGNGCVTVTAVSSNFFSGTVKVYFSIDPIDIHEYTITLGKTSYTYDGKAKEPTVTLTDGTHVVDSSEYTIVYSHNTDAGLAYVEVSGTNHYSGTLTTTFTINQKSIESYSATLSSTSYKYDGKAKKPTVTVKNGSKTISSSNYTVIYNDNKDAGTTTVTIMGTGNYTGTITKTFKITKASQTVSAKAKKSSLAVGGTTTISASTTGNGKLTYKSSDTSVATVSSSGKITAKSVGTVKITVTAAATNNYKKATKTITIKVIPKATKLAAVSNISKKSLTIAWKKTSGVTGYQIQYSTSSSFSSSKTKSITVTGASKLSKVVTGLTKGKTYYVRVRTYKKVDGTKYYSSWSSVKSKKISK